MARNTSKPLDRVSYNLRGLERATNVSRETWRAKILSGELPASRLGRRNYQILAKDVEKVLRQHRVNPRDRAEVEARLKRMLEREGEKAG